VRPARGSSLWCVGSDTDGQLGRNPPPLEPAPPAVEAGAMVAID
jgi:hypothetical protein